MTINLQHGEPLVITGPQGAGKTTLARRIAEQHGDFAELKASELADHFQHWMSDKVKTLIVEGLPTPGCAAEFVKAALENDEVVVRHKGLPSSKVPAPNFIFVSGDQLPLKLGIGRRYRMADLGAAQPESGAELPFNEPENYPVVNETRPTDAMRHHLEFEGSATAEVLADVAGVSSGLVSALLKQDIAAGRIDFIEGHDGQKRVYRHVNNPPPPPHLRRAIEQLVDLGYTVSPPEWLNHE